MIYIDGYGYVDNSIYGTGAASSSSTLNNVSNIVTDTFEEILTTETAKNQTKTYNLDDIFKEAAEKYNVSEDLLKAIAYNESGFQADATSCVGAMGIMQLMPSTAKYLGVEDAYDPYQNIMGGAKLLSTLSDMFDGNETLMIAAYNAGSGNVEKYGGVPPFEETQNYVEKVLSTLQNGVKTEGITVAARDAATTATSSTASMVTEAASSTTSTSALASTTIGGYTYEEYELLMQYFEQMMKIIESMGENDSSSTDDSEDDSLTDLFKLGGSSVVYNNSTINLL